MEGTMSWLNGLLYDIYEKTGLRVRLSPAGGTETRFLAEDGGKAVPLWIDGGEEETEQTVKLLRYLIANRDAGTMPERQEHLKSILLGEGGGWNAFRYMTKYRIPDGVCFAADLVPEKRLEEAAQHIARCLDGGDMTAVMDDKRIAVVKFLSAAEEQSAQEFGQFLCQTLYEDLGVRARVGIGCEMRSFSEIALSYHQAATAVRMSMIFDAKGEVHSYREYLLVKMLEDVPKSRLKEYTEQFRVSRAEEVLEDREMSATAEAFLESSLNLSETARNLFMHRNTLTYRLDKIERITGLDIRKFSDAVTFRVITILYRLLRA